MSLKSDWPKGILFQSQLLYSKTINRGPHNSEKGQKILNKNLEKIRGTNAIKFSIKLQV